MHLAAIHIYPVKAVRGLACSEADVLAGGLRHDRRFMVVGADGVFLSQRKHPRLALVDVALREESLILSTSDHLTPDRSRVEVPLVPDGPRRSVRIWNDTCEAVEIRGEASEFFSHHLGEPCALVFMPDDVVRPVDPGYAHAGDRVSFADGFPVLLATRASLDDVNSRLALPVPMDRFRPNLVVEGGAPFDEERFGRVRVGQTTFRMPKRCSRCVVTTVDQATATVGKEPLRTLATYRKVGSEVYFAQNLIPDIGADLDAKAIAIGDPVTYVDPLETDRSVSSRYRAPS